MHATEQFLGAFQVAFEKGTMVKCTLSKPAAKATAELKNIYLRPVTLKKGVQVAFNFRYKTRDEVKNFPLPEALFQLKRLLGTDFLNADLLTTERDYNLLLSTDGEGQFTSRKPSQTATVETTHNREKHRLLDPSATWLHALGITTLYASPVPLSHGWTKSAHGKIPLPAPATLELLAAAGAPTVPGPGPGELVTPTGAALLAQFATFVQPAMRLTRVGTGAGQRDPAWPNVARLWLGENGNEGGLVELETNIDDMNPELIAAVSLRLFAAGAR